MSTIERAIGIAASLHVGQVDKQGAPYILHPLRVMLALPIGDAQIVAALHDVVEDSLFMLADLAAEGFSPEIVAAIEAISRRPGEEYFSYIDRVKLNPLARLVKLADLRDNLSPSRPIPDSLKARYGRALFELEP